jgi:hypothetical protein
LFPRFENRNLHKSTNQSPEDSFESPGNENGNLHESTNQPLEDAFEFPRIENENLDESTINHRDILLSSLDFRDRERVEDNGNRRGV